MTLKYIISISETADKKDKNPLLAMLLVGTKAD